MEEKLLDSLRVVESGGEWWRVVEGPWVRRGVGGSENV